MNSGREKSCSEGKERERETPRWGEREKEHLRQSVRETDDRREKQKEERESLMVTTTCTSKNKLFQPHFLSFYFTMFFSGERYELKSDTL